jgi:hypothetical protein
MSHFPGTPEMDSRNCPECVPVGLLGLWTAITLRPDFELQWGLNQSCSPQRELFNAVSHSRSARWEQVDSWLLVVGSQIASLTPGPSFAHNLGCRCPNDQCEAILDIYTSRPFQWHQEHPKAKCFGLYCRALNIRESRRTPTPDFSKCWASPPHLAKVGVRHVVWCCDGLVRVSLVDCQFEHIVAFLPLWEFVVLWWLYLQWDFFICAKENKWTILEMVWYK